MMFAARVQLSPNPSLVLARSRRSGCFPAEPYPPLRSLEVYPERAMICNYGTKKRLTFAALSDMCVIWRGSPPFFLSVAASPRVASVRFFQHGDGADHLRASSPIDVFRVEMSLQTPGSLSEPELRAVDFAVGREHDSVIGGPVLELRFVNVHAAGTHSFKAHRFQFPQTAY